MEMRDSIKKKKKELLALLRKEVGAGVSQKHSIVPRATNGPAPLSFAQQRLWFLDQLEPGGLAYIIPFAYLLSGPLHRVALEGSLNEIVQRHEILRTTFVMTENQAMQHICPTLTLPLPLFDLSTLSEDKRELAIEHLISTDIRQPFDLAFAPLLRVKLIRVGAQEHIFLLIIHHIIFDGWSMNIFMQELVTLYEAYLQGKSSPLSPLPLHYADFALWQHAWLQEEHVKIQLDYWKHQLAGYLPVLELPVDHPRPAMPSFQGADEECILSPALCEQLRLFSHQENVTIFMVLLTVFNIFLYHSTGQGDITIGSPVAGRRQAEIEKLIGFFVNTLVLRVDLSGTPSFRDLLQRVREVALQAYSHQDIPFELIVQILQPERNLSYNPLFQVMIAYQAVADTEIAFANLLLKPFKLPIETAKVDLTLYVRDTEHELELTLVYSTDLFEASTARKMLRDYCDQLQQLIAAPDQKIPLRALEGEYARLISHFNEDLETY